MKPCVTIAVVSPLAAFIGKMFAIAASVADEYQSLVVCICAIGGFVVGIMRYRHETKRIRRVNER